MNLVKKNAQKRIHKPKSKRKPIGPRSLAKTAHIGCAYCGAQLYYYQIIEQKQL